MSTRRLRFGALSISLALAACSGTEEPEDAGVTPDAGLADTGPAPDADLADTGLEPDAGPVDSGVDAGVEMDAGEVDAGGFVPPSFGRWEKYEPEGAVCANGSPYKFFVNFVEGAEDVVFIFEGGGACWDYASCTGTGIRSAANRDGLPDDHAASYRSIGGFNVPVDVVYPLLNSDPNVNPLAGWNKVFVPYCTGDVYSGDTTVTYSDPDGTEPDVEFHHVGHANVLATVDMVAEMFPSIPRMFVSGCSAGGAGAIINYHFLRSGLNVGQGFMLDDSGPLFPSREMTSRSLPLQNRVRASWNIDPLVQAAPMSATLQNDLGSLADILAQTYPNDRLGHSHFRLDYNYSLYSYERFYEVDMNGDIVQFGDGSGLGGLGLNEDEWRDRAAVYQLWWDDTELMRAQFAGRDNLGYFMPFYRDTNSSHCLTIPGFEEFPEDELLQRILNDFGSVAWAGTDMMTMNGPMNVRDYVEHLLDDEAPLQSFFEETGEGRYLACTPDPMYYDEAACMMAQ